MARKSCSPVAKGKQSVLSSGKGQETRALRLQRAGNSCSPTAKGMKIERSSCRQRNSYFPAAKVRKFLLSNMKGAVNRALQQRRAGHLYSSIAKGMKFIFSRKSVVSSDKWQENVFPEGKGVENRALQLQRAGN